MRGDASWPLDARAAILIVCAAVSVGCVADPSGDQGESLEGEHSWGSRNVDGPLTIPRGSKLAVNGQLFLGGPLVVEGEMSATNTTIYFQDGVEPRIEVRGGRVDFHNVGIAAEIALVLESGSDVQWTGGEIPYAEFRVEDSVVNLTGTRLVPSASGTNVVEATDSLVRVVNASVEASRILSRGQATVRLVNVAVPAQALEGDGRIEVAFHARLRVQTATGERVPDVSVRAEPADAAFDAVDSRSGADGDAYVELVESGRAGGASRLAQPWRLSADGQPPSGAAVITRNEDVYPVMVLPRV